MFVDRLLSRIPFHIGQLLLIKTLLGLSKGRLYGPKLTFALGFYQICQQRITDILYSEEAQIKKPWGLESMGFLSSSVSLTMERQ